MRLLLVGMLLLMLPWVCGLGEEIKAPPLAMAAAEAAPTAFGCFVDRRWPELADTPWEELCARMRDVGMNSAAIYCYGPDPAKDLAEQIDTGVLAGLFVPDGKVFVLPNFTRPTDSEYPWEILRDAKAESSIDGACWPELILYGPDESMNVTAPDTRFHAMTNAGGFRTAAGCVAPFVIPRMPFLDIVLVQTHPAADLERAKRVIEAYPRELGSYLVIGTIPTGDWYDHIRYFTGIWAWQTGTKYVFVWDYRRLFGYDERNPDDAMERGFRDGVRDYGRLQKIEWGFMPALVPAEVP